MFGYTDTDMIEYYMQYPYNQKFIKGWMRFVMVSAWPMLQEKERVEMDSIKQCYDHLLRHLETAQDFEKECLAVQCLETFYKAVSLYDHSFDRLADAYFYEVCN